MLAHANVGKTRGKYCSQADKVVWKQRGSRPAPKSGATFSWLPNTPAIKVGGGTIKVQGPGKTGRTYSHPIEIDYPYGAEGYKDVQITTVSSNKNELYSIKMAAADTGAPARVMSFVIKTKAKTATYRIMITAKSAKTGLKSSSVLTINFRDLSALGKGGSEGVFTGNALDFIQKKVGVGNSDSWELCYSVAKHGWSASTFRSRCENKGPLFFFQKRKKNGHILGGSVHLNYQDRNNGYIRTSPTEPKAWLFTIKPSAPDKVQIAKKCNGRSGGWRTYYVDNASYLMCMGGGHDMCCRNDGYCWNHLGHDYCPTTSNGQIDSRVDYNNGFCQAWAGGQFDWWGNREGDMYEVYRVK